MTANKAANDILSAHHLFATVRDLAYWLQGQEIDTSNWGFDDAKSVLNLWNEVSRGETQLQADPPLRLVEVVRVIIRRDQRVLVEASQTFIDGRTRERNRPPSEKLMLGEEPLAAARRCLVEEMAVVPDRVTIFPDSYHREQILGESASYPGLQSCYRFHVVEAAVIGLPDTPFSTQEKAPGPGEPVCRHNWEWREEETPGSPPI